MATQRVADMTIDELKSLIEETIDDRFQGFFRTSDSRSVKEINESIRRHGWTPPEGAPSTLQLLREDRDR